MTEQIHYVSVVQDPIFWTVIGFILAAIALLYKLIYNLNEKLTKATTSLTVGMDNLVKVLDKFLEDRKDKDEKYYEWKEKVDEVKIQHKMMTNAAQIIKSHEQKESD